MDTNFHFALFYFEPPCSKSETIISYGGDPFGGVAEVTEMLGRGVVLTLGTAHNYAADSRNIPGFILAARVDNNNNYVPYNPFNNIAPANDVDRRCLKEMKLALVHRYALDDDEAGMYNYFDTEEDFRIKNTLYGYSVEKGNYDAAETYLDTFDDPVGGEQPILSSEQIDFIQIQEINLKRLTDGPLAGITLADENLILDVAQKGRPLDGYARGLYLALFDRHLPIKLPELNDRAKSRGESVANVRSKQIKAGPNPVKDIFSIELIENKSELKISILNVQGQQVFLDK